MDDHAIQTTALALLQSTGYRALRRLECRVNDRTVELYGVVESFYLKQLAQEAVRPITHVKRIENKLNVAPEAVSSAIN